MNEAPLSITAADAAPRPVSSGYPEPFRARVAGRVKRPLGDLFGLRNFGVNLTRLAPGAQSALLHRHTKADEFVFVIEGEATLVTDRGEAVLRPGDCAGFPAGGLAHHLVNRSGSDVVYIEVGDRSAGDAASYPEDDLAVEMDREGRWVFSRRDGTPY